MAIKKKYLPLILGITMALGICLGNYLNFNTTAKVNNSKKEKLNRLIDFIDFEYVENVNTDSIVDVTVNKILSDLDPHSTYIPQKKMQQVTENMKGDFVGIGISIFSVNDTIAVLRTLENSPAKKAGIKAGDRIVYVNNDTVFGKNHSASAFIERIKGKKSSAVNLKIFRKGSANLIDFQLYRDKVPLKSIDAAYLLNDSLGYIKINRFAESTFDEFKVALTNLKAKQITGLVLDLRNNPGGFVSIAEKIADEFLEDKKLILFTKNKQGTIIETYATAQGDFESGRLFVLINEKSASASEIVAGALQDNDKGTIIGQRSFGKGLVQREMDLGDGSAIRLTISKYYTPTGRSIQKHYKKGDYGTYFKNTDTTLHNSTKINAFDSLKFITPKGKVVYGGGGIVPDIYSPKPNTIPNFINQITRTNGVIDNFIFQYLDKKRADFEHYTESKFVTTFMFSNRIISEFETYLNILTNTSAIQVKKPYFEYVKKHLKATLALQLFGLNAYTKVINSDDIMIAKVLEITKH